MNNKLLQFLTLVSGNELVCNYASSNTEYTKIFNKLSFEYDQIRESFDLYDGEEEDYAVRIKEQEIENIHIDVDSLQIGFKNGDRLDFYCDL